MTCAIILPSIQQPQQKLLNHSLGNYGNSTITSLSIYLSTHQSINNSIINQLPHQKSTPPSTHSTSHHIENQRLHSLNNLPATALKVNSSIHLTVNKLHKKPPAKINLSMHSAAASKNQHPSNNQPATASKIKSSIHPTINQPQQKPICLSIHPANAAKIDSSIHSTIYQLRQQKSMPQFTQQPTCT